MHSRRAHGAARVQVGHASVSGILALRFLRELLTSLRARVRGLAQGDAQRRAGDGAGETPLLLLA